MLAFAINYVAVLAAAIVGLVIGFVWYSKAAFGSFWMKELKMKSMGKPQDMPKTISLTFIGLLITAFVLDALIVSLGASSVADGVLVAVAVWLGFYVTFNILRTTYQRTSIEFFAEEVAYEFVTLVLMAVVLTLLL